MTNLEYLKEIEAWLSFNNWPTREQIREFKKSVKEQIEIAEKAPQTEANAFEFSEWCNYNFIRLNGCWVHKYNSQTEPKNWMSTAKLWKLWGDMKAGLKEEVGDRQQL